MIWPDRAGLGLWAILSIGLSVLYAHGMLNGGARGELGASQAGWSRDPLASDLQKMSDSDLKAVIDGKKANPFLNKDGTPMLLTDEDVGIVPVRKADAWDLASVIFLKAGAYCALPFWLVLRTVDFVFAGPSRRRRARVPT